LQRKSQLSDAAVSIILSVIFKYLSLNVFYSYYANITSSIFDKEDMANIVKKSELEK
jgi:hypothetical protein